MPSDNRETPSSKPQPDSSEQSIRDIPERKASPEEEGKVKGGAIKRPAMDEDDQADPVGG